MNCQCTRTTAPDVAACDAKAHCCAPPRVVCEHFCGEKKEKWSGKVLASPPPDLGSLLDEPSADDELNDSPDDDLEP